MIETSNRGNPGGKKGTESKAKILAAAVREFSENGLAGARVDRIAAEAKVNKAMIYYHFSSKELLYREVIKDFLARQMTIVRQQLDEGSSLESVLKGLLDFHAAIFYKKPDTLRLFLRELADPNSETVKFIAGVMKDSGLPNEIGRILSTGARNGAYRPMDVRQALISLITMSIGFFLMSPVFEKVFPFSGEPTFIEERKAAILDLFMHGVKAR